MNDTDLPKGITMHRGKLRIAFRPPNEKNQWKRSLGIPPTKANIKAAEQMLNAIRRDISLGQFDLSQYFPNDPSLKKDKYALGCILDKHYLDANEKRIKPSTHLRRTAVVKGLKTLAGDLEVANLSLSEAKGFRDLVLRESSSVNVANSRLQAVRSAIERAVQELELDEDPFGVMLDPVRSKSRALSAGEKDTMLGLDEVFTIEEAERVVKACKSAPRKRLITFLFWSGLRPGEAAALRREDVCLPYITVKRTLTQFGTIQTPKTGLKRKIYLPSSARSVLEQQLRTHDSENVWLTQTGKPFRSSQLFQKRCWARMLEKAGLVYRKPYSTRHSFASWMLKAGEPEAAVASHLGHANPSMVRKAYGKFIPDAKPVWTLDDPAKIEILKNRMQSVD